MLGDAEGRRSQGEGETAFQTRHPECGTRGSERERIREALLDLCFERGFRNLELPLLLERAEVNEEAFHRYYPDLERCFFEIYAVELAAFRRRAARAREGLTAWRDRVRATAYALYRYVAADARVRRLTTVEVRSAGEAVGLLFGGEVEALTGLIDEGRREPEAPSSLTRATAEQVAGGIFNQLYAAGGRPGPMPPEADVVPKLMYAVVLPYLGAGAASEELTIPPPPLEADERERIRDALLDLCFERGYAAIDEDDLCRRAGVERADFDRRFASLEECFLSFYEPEMRSFMQRMAWAQEGCLSWRDRLRAAAYELFRFLREDERRSNFVVVECRAAGERAQLIFAEGIQPLFELLDEGRQEPEAPPTLTRATADQIGGGIFNELYAALARREPIAIELVAPMMYTAVLPYLGPETAAEELAIQPPPDLAAWGRREERG